MSIWPIPFRLPVANSAVNARMQVAAALANDVERVSSLAETQERIRSVERRLTEIDNEVVGTFISGRAPNAGSQVDLLTSRQ